MASIPNDRPPGRVSPHPGEFLREMLEDLKVTQTAFAAHTGMSMQRISEIINGKRGVTPETAWIIGGSFGQSARYWLNLQSTYDLSRTAPKILAVPMPEAILAAK